MAKRDIYEPLARRLYGDGYTLEQIEAETGVSVTSLSKWKSSTKDPVSGIDEWDRARKQKQSNIQRLKDLFERQLEYIEDQDPEDVSAPMLDTLSKMGALVEKWDKFEKTQRVAEEVVKEVKKAGLSDNAVDSIRSRILGISD